MPNNHDHILECILCKESLYPYHMLLKKIRSADFRYVIKIRPLSEKRRSAVADCSKTNKIGGIC